jgi:hypothetical protein
MIPEGQSFPFPPFALSNEKELPLPMQNKMKWNEQLLLIFLITPKIKYVKKRANLKLNYPLPSHWTLLSIKKKEERTKTKKNPEKTPQLTLSLQRHLWKWRQERKDQKEGFFNTSDEPNQAVWSSLPVPPSSVNRWKSIAQEWTISIQGKKKGKPDHRNLLMKSIREDG